MTCEEPIRPIDADEYDWNGFIEALREGGTYDGLSAELVMELWGFWKMGLSLKTVAKNDK